MKKRNKLIYQVILTAIFAALCFAGTLVQIPLPMEGMVHLGNFVCILAGLLCGGIIGGVAGSLGMGIYDLVFYSAYPTTIARTFILKFIMGFVAGYLFRMLIKKEKPLTAIMYGFGALFVTLFIITTILAVKGNITLIIGNESKTFTVSALVPIFSAIFGIGILLSGIFSKQIDYFRKSVLFTVTVVVIINILAEFLLRIVTGIFIESLVFNAALVSSVVKLPATLITGVFTIILVTLIYPKLFKAVKGINHLNDIEYSEGSLNE